MQKKFELGRWFLVFGVGVFSRGSYGEGRRRTGLFILGRRGRFGLVELVID